MINAILAYAIPDVPNNLQTQLLRERHLEDEKDYKLTHETSSHPVMDENGQPIELSEESEVSRRHSITLQEAMRIRTGIRRNSLIGAGSISESQMG